MTAGGDEPKRPYQFRRLLLSAMSGDREGIRIINDGVSTPVTSM